MIDHDIKQILLTEEEIAKKVKELGETIAKDYKGKDMIVVSILKGASIFTSDLIRNINLPLKMDFMSVSSYGNKVQSSEEIKIIKDIGYDVRNKDILIVEDIVDTGITLDYLIRMLFDRKARSIEVVTLLDKPEGRKVKVSVKYVGYIMPNKFLVGYGLDYAEKYRNLPYVGILKEEVYKKRNVKKT